MTEKTVHITGIDVGYPRRQVIRNLSLPPMRAGTITAMIGPNGAGKTTLLRALAGLTPAKGDARYDGRALLQLAPGDLARHVTYMPQSLPQGVALTVIEAVMTALRVSAPPTPGRTPIFTPRPTPFSSGWTSAASPFPRSTNYLADSAKWSVWRKPSCAAPISCCWTSRPARSTRAIRLT